jgi:hypothetical protein
MVERGSNGFEDFYQAERATLLRAVAFALGDLDLGAEATDEAMARAYERWGDVGSMANPSGLGVPGRGEPRVQPHPAPSARTATPGRGRPRPGRLRRHGGLLGEVLSASCGA